MLLSKLLTETKKVVADFVGDAQPLKALEYLQTTLPDDSGKKNQATLIQSKLNNAKHKELTGQIKFDDLQVELAQASAAILDLSSGLSDADFEAKPATPVSAIPKFVVIYNELDKPHFDKLRRHLGVMEKFKLLRFYDVNGASGVDLVANAKAEIKTADYLLLLVTTNLFSPDPIDWFDVASTALGEGSRMIPLRIENLGFEIPELEKFRALPTMGKWVTDYANQDTAYADIVAGLRTLLPRKS